ncbi:MAG TPA: 4'-phosphopantetheinyl transferase superfamily protein [Kofleriaceae bacterium]|nr:4'-phosphopantetheinyl transferase superfamily protein [Kofleriaceae bacterium]
MPDARARPEALSVTWALHDRAELPASLAWLAPDERARLDAMRIAKRRDDFLLGRWTAKRALAARLSPAPPLAELAIRAAADGAPEAFLDGAPLPLTVSLSHSAGRALAAVCAAPAALGADLERVEPRSALLVDEFFTAGEAAHIAACPPAGRAFAITLIWSAKESALKARRTGLREDPRRVRVELGDAVPWPPREGWHPLQVTVDGTAGTLPGWWRDHGGYVLTLVGDALLDRPA